MPIGGSTFSLGTAFTMSATTSSATTIGTPLTVYHPMTYQASNSSSLSIFDIQALVDRLSYKPGWKFQLLYFNPSGLGSYTLKTDTVSIGLRVLFPVTDVVTLKPTELMFQVQLNGIYQTEKEFLMLIRETLVDIETHEVDEWFKIDGRVHTEPHPTRSSIQDAV